MTGTTTSFPVALALCAWSAFLVASGARAQRRFGCARAARYGWPAAACAPFVVAACDRASAISLAGTMACIGIAVAAAGDARTGYLFDAITLPNAVGTAAIAMLDGHAFEAAAGMSLLVGVFGAIVVVSRGRAMGLGDVKAMYAIGAGLGPVAAAIAIFAASISAIVVHTVLRRGGSLGGTRDEIPFGPHLAVGSTVALYATPSVVRGLGL